ncbi:MAG: efflux RND transporter periplasmic adaptor subunit [Rickettsiales bacterium]|jgi:HlyD family secretion protein|nr:efflux RND transporter periplasmic adaptor subunit [Rickettsiales bacterium]
MNEGGILSRIKGKRKRAVVVGSTAFLVLVIFLGVVRKRIKKFDVKDFDLEEVTVGRIDKIITATGYINPIDIVNVGCLTNGVIEKMYVDYNDKVEKGQKLAKLDAEAKEIDVKYHEADTKRAEASYRVAEAELKRARELYKNKHISKRELEVAEGDATVKYESFRMAAFYRDRAKIELDQFHIESPISGVVVARPVDEGQAVVSNSAAQVLYKIAKDLSKMQIEASVSEADIGLINKDLEVTFTVDAYKNKVFKGKIKQIRLDPAYEQNVVVYIVIIDVDNSDNLLLPGMTAFVSITIDSASNAIRIPNSVFRFKPSAEARIAMKTPELPQNRKSEIADKLKTGNYAYVYVIRKGSRRPEGLLLRKGISDLAYTEVKSGDLKVGDRVISAYLVKKTTAKGRK